MDDEHTIQEIAKTLVLLSDPDLMESFDHPLSPCYDFQEIKANLFHYLYCSTQTFGKADKGRKNHDQYSESSLASTNNEVP